MRKVFDWRDDPKYRPYNPWLPKQRFTADGVVTWKERRVETFDGSELQRSFGTLNGRLIDDQELAERLFVDSLRYLLAG